MAITQRCARCDDYFNIYNSIGQWGCRFHPGTKLFNHNTNSIAYTCCGLSFQDEVVAMKTAYTYITKMDIRGCLRVDHLAMEEATKRGVPVKAAVSVPIRFQDEITITSNYEDETKLDASQRVRPPPGAIIGTAVGNTASLDNVRDPLLTFVYKFPIAWPETPMIERDIRPMLEKFVLSAYADPNFHKTVFTEQDLVLFSAKRRANTIVTMSSQAMRSMTKADLNIYELLYGADAKDLHETVFLSRLLTYERSDIEVPFKIIRRMDSRRDPTTLQHIETVHLKMQK